MEAACHVLSIMRRFRLRCMNVELFSESTGCSAPADRFISYSGGRARAVQDYLSGSPDFRLPWVGSILQMLLKAEHQGEACVYVADTSQSSTAASAALGTAPPTSRHRVTALASDNGCTV